MTTAAEATTALSFAPFQIVMKVTRIPGRTDWVDRDPNDWARNASHWNIALTREGFGVKPTIYTEYSMGSAHKGAPNLADVMHSLHSDSRGVEGTTFESWAADYGYETDSRKAESIYRGCVSLNGQMRQLFTPEELDQLDILFSDY